MCLARFVCQDGVEIHDTGAWAVAQAWQRANLGESGTAQLFDQLGFSPRFECLAVASHRARMGVKDEVPSG